MEIRDGLRRLAVERGKEAMHEHYSIASDRATGVVEIQIIGFWTVAIVEELEGHLRRIFDDIVQAGKVPVLFSDSSRAAVQSAEVVAAMTQVGKNLAPLPRKTAILSTIGQLLQFQAKRVVEEQTALRTFATREQAIAWLTEPEPPVA